MKPNYKKLYGELIGKEISFNAREGSVQGKLESISGNEFTFNPYIKKRLVHENEKIFHKRSVISENCRILINDPLTNILITEWTKGEMEKFCLLNNLIEEGRSPTYKKTTKIGLH